MHNFKLEKKKNKIESETWALKESYSRALGIYFMTPNYTIETQHLHG